MDERSGPNDHDVAMHPCVRLARIAVEHYVSTGVIVDPPDWCDSLARPAAVFVSIKKRRELRGCIGTFSPTQPTLAHEIVRNAINSATRDPRFPPIECEELALLEYSVDVLSQPKPIEDVARLDPRRHGVIVVQGVRRGVLLPDLDGIDTVEQQLAIARAKAGIRPGEEVEVLFFEVQRFN